MSLSASSSLRARLENAARVLNEMDSLAVGNCALADLLREASAALDAHQEEENQSLREGSSQPTRTPEATPKALDCPCGLSDEPWHWPRGGVCKVGAEMPLKGER
jgi:hypothetical protein